MYVVIEKELFHKFTNRMDNFNIYYQICESKSCHSSMGCASPKPEEPSDFKLFDVNGDKRISCDEVMATLKTAGVDMTENAVKAVIALADSNSDGQIEKQEFGKLMTLFFSVDLPEMIFKIADRDKNGLIDDTELKILCNKVKWEIPVQKQMSHDEFIQFAVEALK